MLPRQAVYVHHSQGAGSDLPTRLNAESATVVAADAPDPTPSIASAGGKKSEMCLIFAGGSRSGTLTEIRSGPRPDLFLVRTTDRTDVYLVQIDPEMARKITETWRRNDPSQAYAAHLARSLERQQQEARRRLAAGG
jgi:hypothetical protein